MHGHLQHQYASEAHLRHHAVKERLQRRLHNLVEASWNVMAHAQKPYFVFRRKGRVHLNRWGGRQFSRLLTAEVCASAVVMLDIPCSGVVWRVLATHSICHFPPSLPLPCVTVCRHISTGVYSDQGNEVSLGGSIHIFIIYFQNYSPNSYAKHKRPVLLIGVKPGFMWEEMRTRNISIQSFEATELCRKIRLI